MNRNIHRDRDGGVGGETQGSIDFDSLGERMGTDMNTGNLGSPAVLGLDQINGGSEDLLVFGYESKLYRDDDKAKWIDGGQHLIPWMGDTSVLIDRYDVRGLLTDLSHGSSPSTIPPNDSQIIDLGFDDRPTPLEQVEQLCEVERCLSLNNEDDDELTFHEMEFKRLQSAVSGIGAGNEDGNYSSVGFNYNSDGTVVRIAQNESDELMHLDTPTATASVKPRRKSVHETPFLPPGGLQIPPGMTMPTKMKIHAIIEKTAKFVANHGPQMEIIVKTKQAHNKHFNFLYYNDPLNDYYKNLLQAIKENSYKPSEETSTVHDEDDSSDENSEDSASAGDDDGPGYLHPSLMKRIEGTIATNPISLQFRPSANANSAYSMLVSKIKLVTGEPTSQEEPDQPPPPLYPYPGDEACGYYDPSLYVYGTQDLQDQNNGYQGGISYGDPAQQVPRTEPPPERSKPNTDEQSVIEKMASYVIKNGPAFEAVAGTKGDQRFEFLNPSHPHHWYYLNCKKRFSVEATAVVASGNPVGYKSTESTTSSTTQSTTTTTTTTTSTTANSIKANHANALSRMATLPPELINKIEELRKKTQQNKLLRESQQQEAMAEKKPVIKFSSSLASVNLGGNASNADGMASASENIQDESKSFQPTLVSYAVDDVSDKCENDPQDNVNQRQAPEAKVNDSGWRSPSEPLSIKEERKRKAALFLQRLQRSGTDKENGRQAQADSIQPIKEVIADIGSPQTEDRTSQKRPEFQESQDGRGASNKSEKNESVESETTILNTDGTHNEGPSSTDSEVEEPSTDPTSKSFKHSRHRKRRRSRSRKRTRSRSKGKRRLRESTDSSVTLIHEGLENSTQERKSKHKSHKKHKREHESRIDDNKRSRKTAKKKKKHHKSSKSGSRKIKAHQEK